MKKTMLYRHGDVLLKRVDKIPKGVNKINTRILKEGEATGHMHEMVGGLVSVFADAAGTKYVEVKEKTKLIHPEHNALQIQEGEYVLIDEREYNIFAEEIKQVLD